MKNGIKALVFLLITTPSLAVIVDQDIEPKREDVSQQLNDLLSGVNDLASPLLKVITAYNSGKTIQAKDQISKILSATPEDPKALHVAGIIFIQEKRYKNAQVAFEAALRSGVKNPAILSKLGMTRILMGDHNKGQKILNLALSLDNKNKLALKYLAWMAESKSYHQTAIDYYKRLINIEKPKTLSPFHIALARSLTKANQFEGAVKVLMPYKNEISNINNALNNTAVVLLLESYIQTGKNKFASSLIKKVQRKKQTTSVQLAVFKTELLIKQKKYKQAQSFINSAVKKESKQEHLIRYAASTAFAQQNENKKAIDQLKLVVKFLGLGNDKNKLFSAINDLASLYVTSDRKIDALRLLQKNVKLYPKKPKLGYQLAELQTSMGQLTEATQTLDNVLYLKSDYVSAYYLKGIIARREKEYDDADMWFTKVNKMEPTHEKAWVQRAASFIDAGDNDNARKTLASAVKINNENAFLWFEYGALLTNLQRHDDAILAYKTVLSNFPDHLPSIDNLAGELLLVEKNPQEALHYAVKAIQMDPSDKVLQLNYLEALYQNKKFKFLIDNAEKIKKGLEASGKYQYLLGASYYKNGNLERGKAHLELATKDSSLDDRYRNKISRLLNH